MAEWFYEDGIGETRAILVDKGRIVEAQIEREDDGIRAGSVVGAKLIEQLIPRLRGIVMLDGAGGEQALLEPIPPKLAVGARLTVEIDREAIAESGRAKLAKCRPAAAKARIAPGKPLLQRIRMTGHQVRTIRPHEEDLFEVSGWSELIEEARSGVMAFDGGELRLALTPAMAVIDVDGPLKPDELLRRSAPAVVTFIRRLGLTGSIAIDFPTVEAKAPRLAAADAIDKNLPPPFERTAINGFGLMQIVRRRERASIAERVAHAPVMSAALALLRRAERAQRTGTATLTAAPATIALLERRPDWGMRLARTLGREIALKPDPALDIWGGHVA